MISDGHLIPSGIDFGTPASAFQKQEAPTLIFMTQSQETSAFLAIFVQFPPATAKTQPRTWHHSISASPSGGNAATRIPCLQLQGLTTHLLGLLEKWRKCFGNTRIKIRIMKNEQNWLGCFGFFSLFHTIYVSKKFHPQSLPQIFLVLCNKDSFHRFAPKHTCGERTLW